MQKFVKIALKRLELGGSDLGRDYKIEFRLNDRSCTFEVELPEQRFLDLDAPLFLIDYNAPTNASFAIKAIEEDTVFDDIGSLDTTMLLDLSQSEEQIFVFEMDIHGIGQERRKVAKATLIIAAELDSGARYVSDVKPAGWLKVKMGPDNTIKSLPHGLHVDLISVGEGREYFLVKEGSLEGQHGSVTLSPVGVSYLEKSLAHLEQALLVFNSSTRRLTVEGLGEFNAITSRQDPIGPGIYDIEIPSELHKRGRDYLHLAKHAQTWFRLGHEGSRFLHPGLRSNGCVTVTDLAEWEKIYNHMILSRKDSKSVGTLHVQ